MALSIGPAMPAKVGINKNTTHPGCHASRKNPSVKKIINADITMATLRHSNFLNMIVS